MSCALMSYRVEYHNLNKKPRKGKINFLVNGLPFTCHVPPKALLVLLKVRNMPETLRFVGHFSANRTCDV